MPNWILNVWKEFFLWLVLGKRERFLNVYLSDYLKVIARRNHWNCDYNKRLLNDYTVKSHYNEHPLAAGFCSLYPEVHYNESRSLWSRIGFLPKKAKSIQNYKSHPVEKIPFCGYFRFSGLNSNKFAVIANFWKKKAKFSSKKTPKMAIFYNLTQKCSLYPECETMVVHYTGSDIWSKRLVSPKMFIITGGSL